jgi:hypothetical protein
MRKAYCIMAWVGLACLGLAMGLQAGCLSDYDDLYLPLTNPALADAGTPACAGDPTMDPAIVTEQCGVFVSASAAPGGDGKEATPFQTFADAAAVKPSRIFACAGTYTETVQVSFTGGVEVYGGFTGCSPTSWTWSGSMQAQIATAANAPGVVLIGGANKLENVSVTAPSAPATMPGGSSIALLVNGGSLDMTNGALSAGDAQNGAAGASGNATNLDGITGTNGASTCDPGATHMGPAGAALACATGGTTRAGNGGDGGDPGGDPAAGGTDGTPANTSQPTDGIGGAGEGQGTPPATSCNVGAPGANGVAGGSGNGAAGPGTLSGDGYLGSVGQDGTNGTPGQGGGGGGGAKGGLSILCGSSTVAVPGASGGAGGTGGCGGAMGTGGKAGGSSIALLVLDAQVTLTKVTLTAGKGGNGGAGGSGQGGGNKGPGGMPGAGAGSANGSCPGGYGGQGGVGGPGGGGQGGYSLGIAFQGTTAPTGGTFTIDMTNNGKGGAGGMNNTAANMGAGVDGVAGNCWDFMKNTACGM